MESPAAGLMALLGEFNNGGDGNFNHDENDRNGKNHENGDNYDKDKCYKGKQYI